MLRPDQEWECTIVCPDGSRDVRRVTVPIGMAQASAEVKALREVAGVALSVPEGYRCASSRFVREVES